MWEQLRNRIGKWKPLDWAKRKLLEKSGKDFRKVGRNKLSEMSKKFIFRIFKKQSV